MTRTATPTQLLQRRRTVELREIAAAAEPHSPSWQGAINEAISLNDRLLRSVANRLTSQYAIGPDGFDDVLNELRIILMDCIAGRWDPTQLDLARVIYFEGLGRVRAMRESSTGYGAAVAARRRLIRAERMRRELHTVLRREPTDQEVVDALNHRAHTTQKDPARSGSLTTVDELRRSRDLFTASAFDADTATGVLVGAGDSIYQPGHLVAPTETRAFLASLVDRIELEHGAACRDAFVARYRLDGNVHDLGGTRPFNEVAKMTGMTIVEAKVADAHARETAGRYVQHADHQSFGDG